MTTQHGPRDDAYRASPLAYLLLAIMRAWQWVPRIDQQRCRFYPSCSAYGITAVRRYGAFRGGWLAARRLGRCHPWNPGGVDHVPSRVGERSSTWWRTATTSEGR